MKCGTLVEICLWPHLAVKGLKRKLPGADLGAGCRGCAPPSPEMTCGFLIQLVFCQKKTMWFIGVEVEQETSAPPPKRNPGPAHGSSLSVDVRRLKRFCLSSPLLLTKEQRESDLYCEEGLDMNFFKFLSHVH